MTETKLATMPDADLERAIAEAFDAGYGDEMLPVFEEASRRGWVIE